MVKSHADILNGPVPARQWAEEYASIADLVVTALETF